MGCRLVLLPIVVVVLMCPAIIATTTLGGNNILTTFVCRKGEIVELMGDGTFCQVTVTQGTCTKTKTGSQYTCEIKSPCTLAVVQSGHSPVPTPFTDALLAASELSSSAANAQSGFVFIASISYALAALVSMRSPSDDADVQSEALRGGIVSVLSALTSFAVSINLIMATSPLTDATHAWASSGEPLTHSVCRYGGSVQFLASITGELDGINVRISSGYVGVAIWTIAGAVTCRTLAAMAQRAAEARERAARDAARAASEPIVNPMAVFVLDPEATEVADQPSISNIALQREKRKRYEEVVRGRPTKSLANDPLANGMNQDDAEWLALRGRLVDEGVAFAVGAQNANWESFWRRERGYLERETA